MGIWPPDTGSGAYESSFGWFLKCSCHLCQLVSKLICWTQWQASTLTCGLTQEAEQAVMEAATSQAAAAESALQERQAAWELEVREDLRIVVTSHVHLMPALLPSFCAFIMHRIAPFFGHTCNACELMDFPMLTKWCRPGPPTRAFGPGDAGRFHDHL